MQKSRRIFSQDRIFQKRDDATISTGEARAFRRLFGKDKTLAKRCNGLIEKNHKIGEMIREIDGILAQGTEDIRYIRRADKLCDGVERLETSREALRRDLRKKAFERLKADGMPGDEVARRMDGLDKLLAQKDIVERKAFNANLLAGENRAASANRQRRGNVVKAEEYMDFSLKRDAELKRLGRDLEKTNRWIKNIFKP